MKTFLRGLLLLLVAASPGLATTITNEMVNDGWYPYGTQTGNTVSLASGSNSFTVTSSFTTTNLISGGAGIELDPGFDARPYRTLQMTYKLTSNNPIITSDGKQVEFVLYTATHPEVLSQNGNSIPAIIYKQLIADGASHTVTVDLGQVRQMAGPTLNSICINLDPLTYASIYQYSLQVTSIKLVGASGAAFDGESMPAAMTHGGTSSSGVVTTPDGLNLFLSSTGGVVNLYKLGTSSVILGNTAQPGGFLIRDNTTGAAPVQVSGTIAKVTGGYQQTGSAAGLNVNATCSYTVVQNSIHVAMTATNTGSGSRFLTLYFALPLTWKNWVWQSNLLHAVPVGAPSTSNAAGPFYEETTYQYPLAALTTATGGGAGVSLAVPLDKPRNYRIEYNEQYGLFYVAFDIALTNLAASAGGNFNTATCDVYLSQCDPTWSFRSALQNFYTTFPQWFAKRTGNGGWQVPGYGTEPGLRFYWNIQPGSTWNSNVQAGIPNFMYILPSAGDMAMSDESVTNAAALARITNLTAGSAPEWAGLDSDSYTGWGTVPYGETNLENYWDMQAHSYLVSGDIDINGNRVYNFNYGSAWGNAPGGQEGFGISPPCNLDPLIPNGLGANNNAVLLEDATNAQTAGGTAPDGWAFDEYIFDETYDYNAANFTYSPFPLTFERDVQQIAVPLKLTIAAWAQNLAQQSWSTDKLQFGNLQGTFTYAAATLDLFGLEGGFFNDPGYYRTLAAQKVVTYLPYTPKQDPDTYYNLLYGIYPGAGLDDYQYQAMVPVLDAIMGAGWNPVTYATASNASIRVERYGSGDPFFIVCYNTDGSAHTFNLTLNTTAIGRTPAKAVVLFAGSTGGTAQGTVLTPSAGTVALTLGAGETCVVEMEVATPNTAVSFTVAPIAGDTDVLAPGAGQTVAAAYYFGSGSAAVNGVTFHGITPGNGTIGNITVANEAGWGNSISGSGAPFGSLSGAYQTVLGETIWAANNTSPLVVTVGNLAVGQHYTVRFWEQYAHGSWGEHDIYSSGTGPSSSAVEENNTYFTAASGDSSHATNGTGEYVTATFTATASTQTFNIRDYYGDNSNAYGQLTAFEVVQGP